ncbi:MAG: hypothetical protein PVF45_00415 [Anaerolineae bacterium]|jgi:hypothetical protein
MTTQTVSVGLPRSVFLKLERAAELTHCTIEEDVLTTTVNAALVEHPDLPADLANELSAMHLFSDEALWAASHPCLSPAEQVRLSQLNHKAGERPLTQVEAAEQEHLLNAYHRSVLRRAKALAILAQRGHPLPDEPKLPDDAQ